MELGKLNREEIIKELANKYKLPKNEVEKAVQSQFKFVNAKMRELGTVRLPFFGVFKPNLKRKKKIDEQNRKK